MVSHDPSFRTVWTEWAALVESCEPYAALCGWRFVKADFMAFRPGEPDEMRSVKERALPMALEFADRIQACIVACDHGAEPPRLLSEFQACQRLVASEAVYNSMVATVSAVGLGPPAREGATPAGQLAAPLDAGEPPLSYEAAASASAGEVDEEEDPDAFSYQDMSQPIEVIARRLMRFHARLTSNPDAWDERQRRLLHASFIVEFGLEHGLPEQRDPSSETTLKEFLERLGAWEGSGSSDVVRSLVLSSIPEGPAREPLRKTTLDWFDEHKGAAIIGGAIIGGLIGVVAAAATVAIASGGRGGAGPRGRR